MPLWRRPKRHRTRHQTDTPRPVLPIVAGVMVLALSAGCSSGSQPANQATSPAQASAGTGLTPAVSLPTTPTVPAEPGLPSYADLLSRTNATVAAAKTVAIRGRLAEGSQAIDLDVRGNIAGTNSLALITDPTGTLTFLVAADAIFVKADAAYWTKQIGKVQAEAIGASWVDMPPGTKLGNITVAQILGQTVTTFPNSTDLVGGQITRTVMDDLPVYSITSPDGLRVLYVYVNRPYPVRYVEYSDVPTTATATLASPATTTGAPGTPGDLAATSPAPSRTAVTDIHFTKWNEVPPNVPPPANQVIRAPR